MVKLSIPFLICGLLLAGCGGSKNSRRPDLNREDLKAHQHVLVVGAGPVLVKLKVGLAGKVLMKGLSKILEGDRKGSFAESLQEIGMLPRETAVETGVAALGEMGWKTTTSGKVLDSAGKNYKKVKLPEGICEEAASAGADSAMILYERFDIDVGATDALARTELWAHFFECPGKKLLWRGKDRRKMSLNRFIVEAVKQAIVKKKKTLADFLGSLRKLTEDSSRDLIKSEFSFP
ncbi:MAG TPA: hypothetical protein VM425_19150 [Myxococcota bacterium]|nr:hypothetical protein [Myxococcota bacterium]